MNNCDQVLTLVGPEIFEIPRAGGLLNPRQKSLDRNMLDTKNFGYIRHWHLNGNK